MSQIIFHIDMNSYFASVEQQANPHLRGVPCGVCEHLGGIILAASVEAKRLGIKTGTPAWEARKIFPGIVLLPVDPPKCRQVTQGFLKIFSEYTSHVEPYSIDEAFLDMTEVCDWRSAVFRALEIKQRIRREVGEWLTCSVGVGPNKLVAKIASDLDKPDGVTVIKPEEVDGLYEKLSLTDVPGINVRTERRLNLLGIYRLRDLADFSESALVGRFGIWGKHLSDMGKLHSEAEVGSVVHTPKSMGHAFTLSRPAVDYATVKKLLRKLSEKVALRLRRAGLWGRTVGCYVRFVAAAGEDKRYFGAGRSHRMKENTYDGRVVFAQAEKIFRSFGSSRPVRMAAVTVADLTRTEGEEPLFEVYKKRPLALSAIDRVNARHGDLTLRPAVLFGSDHMVGDTVGFGRLKG
jgi:DNA polymerase-4